MKHSVPYIYAYVCEPLKAYSLINFPHFRILQIKNYVWSLIRHHHTCENEIKILLTFSN